MKEQLLNMLKACEWTYVPGCSLDSLMYEDDSRRYFITCSDYSMRLAVFNKEENKFEYQNSFSVSIIFNKLTRKLYLKAQRKINKLRKAYAVLVEETPVLSLEYRMA